MVIQLLTRALQFTHLPIAFCIGLWSRTIAPLSSISASWSKPQRCGDDTTVSMDPLPSIHRHCHGIPSHNNGQCTHSGRSPMPVRHCPPNSRMMNILTLRLIEDSWPTPRSKARAGCLLPFAFWGLTPQDPVYCQNKSKQYPTF